MQLKRILASHSAGHHQAKAITTMAHCVHLHPVENPTHPWAQPCSLGFRALIWRQWKSAEPLLLRSCFGVALGCRARSSHLLENRGMRQDGTQQDATGLDGMRWMGPIGRALMQVVTTSPSLRQDPALQLHRLQHSWEISLKCSHRPYCPTQKASLRPEGFGSNSSNLKMKPAPCCESAVEMGFVHRYGCSQSRGKAVHFQLLF